MWRTLEGERVVCDRVKEMAAVRSTVVGSTCSERDGMEIWLDRSIHTPTGRLVVGLCRSHCNETVSPQPPQIPQLAIHGSYTL